MLQKGINKSTLKSEHGLKPLTFFQVVNTGNESSHINDISSELIASVLKAVSDGIWSIYIIAEECQTDTAIVHRIISMNGGYGKQPYGRFAYGRCKVISKGGSSVQRRVSTTGQLTYRTKVYTLGKAFRGRTASVIDRGVTLEISFGDRQTLSLTNRLNPSDEQV